MISIREPAIFWIIIGTGCLAGVARNRRWKASGRFGHGWIRVEAMRGQPAGTIKTEEYSVLTYY